MRSVLRILGVVAVVAVSLELILRLLVAAGEIPHQVYPETRRALFWDYIDPVTGIWKPPHTTFRHQGGCIDVEYRSNAFGMRDRERALESTAPRRVVMLGDSVVEGFGVAREHRFGDLIEAREGVEYLNFGSSGHFGTIQSWLLYEKLAARFDHDEVIFFVLPSNDFHDNDPARWRKAKYRPFLRRAVADAAENPVAASAEAFEVYYRIPFEQRDRAIRSTSKILSNRISNASYLANALRWAAREVKMRREAELTPHGRSYTAPSAQDLAILQHSLRETIAAAGERRFRLVLVPDGGDVEAELAGDGEVPLARSMREFAATEGIEFLDLAPEFAREIRATGRSYSEFTLGCDPHWGPLGHAFVARVLAGAGATAHSRGDSQGEKG